jgi:hypothetical protein
VNGRFIALLSAALLLAAAPSAAPIATPFATVARALAGAGVPVLAPTRVPADYGTTYATAKTYASQGLRERGYEIVLGGVPNCLGTACTFAVVEAGSASMVEHGPGRAVLLANGTRATFASLACGANCMGSTSIWFRRGEVYYAVEGKADSRASLLIIANSLRPLK